MKPYDDQEAWGIETPEQQAAFQELVDFANSFRHIQLTRAKAVFDAFCDDKFPPGVDPDNPLQDAEISHSVGQWRIRLNRAIRENLDHRSIESFMVLVSDQRTKVKQTILANKRHEETNQTRRFVMAEWRLHKAAYEGNKSAFTRDYVRRIKHEFDVTITEKQMREVWLKDTPPATKPDGMPANGE